MIINSRSEAKSAMCHGELSDEAMFNEALRRRLVSEVDRRSVLERHRNARRSESGTCSVAGMNGQMTVSSVSPTGDADSDQSDSLMSAIKTKGIDGISSWHLRPQATQESSPDVLAAGAEDGKAKPISLDLVVDTAPAEEAMARMRPLLEHFSDLFGDVIAEGFADLAYKGIETRLIEGGPAAGADSRHAHTVVVSIPWVDEVFPAVRANHVDGR